MDKKHNRTPHRLWLLAGPALLMADVAYAQQPPALEELVVTARKREESLQEVPVAVTAFSGESLRNQSVQSIRDVQQQTPSLSLSPGSADRNALVVTIRGQTNSDLLLTVDPAVGIYIDGVNLAKTITAELANLTDLERVEVLKGPQGTLYGRNTTGGSINLFTRLPTFDAEGEVSLRVGQYNTYGGGLVINLPLVAEKAALRIAGSYTHRDPFGENVFTGRDLGGDLNGGTVRATLLTYPAESLEFILRGDYTTSSTTATNWKAQGLIPGSVAATLVGGRLGLGAAATTPAGRAQAAAAYAASGDVGDFHDTNQDFSPSLSDVYSWGTSGTLTWTLSDNLEAKSISAYRVADRMTFYDLDGSPFPILHTNGYTHQEVFSQELQLAGDAVDGRLNWIIGGYYSREFGFDGTQSISLNSFATRSFNEGHVTNKSIAGFGQATFNITDQFGITAGLRYTEEEKRLVSANRRLDGLCNLPVDLRLPGQCLVIRDDTWDALNYSFSLDYKPVDGVLLYAKTSTGFRSGGHNLRGGIDPITFETFDPEHVTDYEIGLKGDWLDGRLRTNLAAYYTKYKDIQRAVLVPSTLNPSSTVVRNAARATIYGGEAEVTFIPVDNLTLRATAGLTEPEYEEYRDGLGVDLSDQPFTYIPDRTYSLSAAYVMPMESGDLRFQVDWAWRGRVYYDDDSLFNGTNGLPDLRGQDAFGLLNARVSKRYESLNLDIALYGKNILDEEYIAGNLDTSTTALGFNSAVPGEPAIWGLELTKRFP